MIRTYYPFDKRQASSTPWKRVARPILLCEHPPAPRVLSRFMWGEFFADLFPEGDHAEKEA